MKEYIEELEEENEKLREALSEAFYQLSENWSESLTLGLLPNIHYYPKKPDDKRKYIRKKWNSLRLIREYIKTKCKNKKIYLKRFDAGDNKLKIYDDASVIDSDGNVITFYYIEVFEE